MKKYLTIFCMDGTTLRFNHISNLVVSENIKFEYLSESTKEPCRAVFGVDSISGYSYTLGEDNE